MLALDKTGTISHGKSVQTDIVVFGDVDPEEARCLVASLAGRSDHPVSPSPWQPRQSVGSQER